MKTSANPSVAKVLLLALMFVSYTDTYVFAAPKGGHAVSGTASFTQDGNLTVITAGNRSVINYASFNIAPGETVRFVQPSSSSSVLNRVTDPSPTNIFGSLQANGNVYIVNPYGVFFQNGAVLNVGSLYAGAGKLSDADFTKGRIHFTDLAGDVRNDGVLAADNRIVLMGANVTNNGTMTSARGLATMVSGRDVYVGERNSNVFVQAGGGTAKTTATAAAGSVTNNGTVSAPRVLLGAGDLYSTAIVNSGLLKGHDITVNAGRNGMATVSGRLDASATGKNAVAAAGKGGNVQVLGGTVALRGAAIDASGTTGGGAVRVGGDLHGGGTLAHASTTSADAATTINADATDKGDGGSVVLWSDQATTFAGNISARGGPAGGNGGAAEVSSANTLYYQGSADLRAAAGAVGTLLLDPDNIVIDTVGTSTLLAVPTPPTTTVGFGAGGANETIAAATLATALGTSNVILDANNDITFRVGITLAAGGHDLTLNAGHSINIGDPVTPTNATLALNGAFTATFNATGGTKAPTAATPAVFAMTSGSAITTPGAVKITDGGVAPTNSGGATIQAITTDSANAAAGTITVDTTASTGAPITVNGALSASGNNNMANTAGGNVSLTAAGGLSLGANTVAATGTGTGKGGNVALTATSGALTAGTISTAAGGSGQAGNINLTSKGALTAGTLTATSATGQGGNVTLTLNNVGGATPLTLALPSISTAGATGGGSIAASNLNTVAGSTLTDANALNTTGTGANATGGAVSLSTAAGNLTLSSPVTTNGAGTGAAGTVSLTAGLGALQTGTITATGVTGNGGGVTLAAQDTLTAGTITTTSTNGTGGPVELTLNDSGAGSSLTLPGITTSGGTAGGSITASITNGVVGDQISLGAALTSTGTGVNAAGGAITLQGPDISVSESLNSTGTGTGGGGLVSLTDTDKVQITSAINGGSLKTGAGTTLLDAGNAVTTTGAAGQTYGGPVTVNTDTTLQANNGAVNFNTSLDTGTYKFTVSAGTGTVTIGTGATLTKPVLTGSGTDTFTAAGLALDGTAAAGTLDASAVNVTTLSGATVTTSGTQSYGQVLQGTNATLSTTNANLVAASFNNAGYTLGISVGTGKITLGGADHTAAVLVGSGADTFTANTLTLNGIVASLGSLDATAVDVTTPYGATVATTGTQGYKAVLLGAGTTFSTTNSTFTAASLNNAGFNLGVSAGTGTVTLGGADHTAAVLTGSGTDTFTAGTLTLNGVVASLGVLDASAAGTTTLEGATVTTTGAQSYKNVTLGTSVTLTTQSATAGQGKVSFGGTVDGAAADTQQLTVTTKAADASVTFGGKVGTAGPLLDLTVNSPTTFISGGSVTTTTGSATDGKQTYNAVTLGADAVLTGSLFSATGVNGSDGVSNHSLTLNFTGTTAVSGIFTNIRDLTVGTTGNTTLTGTVATTGIQDYKNTVTLLGNTILTSTGKSDITFEQTVESDSSATPRDLSVSTPGNEIFLGTVGSGPVGSPPNALGSLLTDVTGTVGGSAMFRMTAGANGGVNVNNEVTVNDAAFFRVLGSTATTPSVKTGGTQSYGPYGSQLGADTYLLSTGGAAITLGTTAGPLPAGQSNLALDNATKANPHALTLDTTGATAIHGLVGSVNPIGSLLITAGQSTTFSGDTLTPGVGSIVTTGAQTYNSPLILSANETFRTTDAALGTITFNRTFSSDPATPLRGLTTSTAGGDTIFAAGSGTTPGSPILASLTTSALGTTRLFFPTTLAVPFTTNGAQNYQGVTEAETAVLALASNGGDITFGKALNSTADTALTTVTPAANTTFFQGTVGAAGTGLTRFASVKVASLSSLGGSVLTTGDQTYGGNALLAGTPLTLDSSSGAVSFGGTLDGAAALTVNLGTSLNFAGLVGGETTLLSLSVPAGTVNINGPTTGGAVTTSGFQSYGGTVAASVPATFNAGGVGINIANLTSTATPPATSGVTINATASTLGQVNLQGGLTVNDSVGSALFNGTVTTTKGGGVFASAPADVTFSGAVLADGGVTAAATNGNATFGSTVNAGGDVTATSAKGNTYFQDAVLSGGNVSAAGVKIFLDGATVGSTGSQSYNGPAFLGADGTLTAGTSVTFLSTLDSFGAQRNLTINATGDEIFSKLVGSQTPLLSLTTDAVAPAGGGAHFNMTIAPTDVAGVRVGDGGIKINDQAFFAAAGGSSALVPTAVSGAAAGVNRPTITSTGPQQYLGAVAQLGADTVLQGQTTLSIPAGVNGSPAGTPGAPYSLTLDFGGAVAVSGAFTGLNNFASVGVGGTQLAGTFSTAGFQYYRTATTLTGATALTSTGNKVIYFDGTLDGPYTLSIDTGGDEVFNQPVGSAAGGALASLTIDAAAGKAATGTTSFNQSTPLAAGAAFVNVGGGGLTVNDQVAFNVTGAAVGTTLAARSGGVQTYNGAATLGGDVALTNTNGNAITFGSTVNSTDSVPYNLTLNSAGDEVFGGLVGAGTNGALLSLTTDADPAYRGGRAIFNVPGGAQVITVNNVPAPGAATGAQTYNDAVLLNQDTLLSSTALGGAVTAGGAVTFNGTVNSNGTPASLTVLAGPGQTAFAAGTTVNAARLDISGALVTFNGSVGGAAGGALNVLTVGRNGTNPVVNPSIDINNAGYTTAAGQMYRDPVVLSGDVTLTSTAQSIEFVSTVDTDLPSPATHSLTLNAPQGSVTFDALALVGSLRPLTSLTTTTANGTNFNMVLAGGRAGITTGGGGVTVNGPANFAVTNSLLTGVAQPTVRTGGAILLNGAVTLNEDTSLYGTGTGDITFNGAVNSGLAGSRGLALNTAGNEIFNAAATVGAFRPLTSFTTDAFITPGGQTQLLMDAAGGAGLRVGPGAAPLTVGTVNNVGVYLNDGVRFGVANSSLNTPSVLVFGGGTQTYNGAASLTASTVLVGDASAAAPAPGAYNGGGAINFAQAVVGTGAPDLLVRTGTGTTTFRGAVSVGTLDVAGARVSFAGPVSGLGALTVAPNGGMPGAIDLNGLLVTTVGAQIYRSPVTLSQDATLAAGPGQNITFGDRVDGAFNLRVNTSGNTIFGGAAGSTAPLLSLTTDAGGATFLNGGSVTTAPKGALTGSQTYNDPVFLGGATTLADTGTGALGGMITLAKADSNGAPAALTVNAQSIRLNGAVGSAAPLLSLAALGGGTTTLNGGSVTTTAGQTYGSLAGTTLGTTGNLNAGTDIRFLSTLDAVPGAADTSLTLTAAGQVLFAGPVGTTPLTRLTVNAGTAAINGGLVGTTFGQTYNAATLLGAATTFQSAQSGDILFNGTLDGAVDARVLTGGLTAFNAQVGGTTALGSLSTDAGGQTQFNISGFGGVNPAGVNVSGFVAVGDSVTFNVPNSTAAHPTVQTAAGAQDYAGAATLGADTVLMAGNNAALRFGSTINGAASLTLNTGGLTSLGGFVGGTTPLTSLLTDAGGQTQINGGGVATNGPGTQTYNDAVLLGADAVLSTRPAGSAAASGDITFNSTLDGGLALTINSGGRSIFNGLVGSGAALTGLTVNSAAAPGAGTQFNMAVGGAAAGVLVNGSVAVFDPMSFNVAGSSLARPGVLTLGNGNQTYNGPVSLAANTVLVSAAGPVDASGAFAGGGAFVFGPGGIVSNGGANLSVRAGTGNVSFAGSVGVASLDLGGANVAFGGPINLTGLLSVEPNGGGTGGTILLNGGSLTTAGAQTYNAAVVLGADTVLTSLNTTGDGGSIVFNGTVDGDGVAGRGLVVNSSGDGVFNGAVGGTAALASLTTDAGGRTLINGGGVSTLRFQNYHDPVLLGADAVLSSQNVAGDGDIHFFGSVDGAVALTVNTAGSTVFDGVVGGTMALTSLLTDAPGATFLNGGAVTTTGAQTYNDGVLLGNTAVLASQNTGDITFGATLDGGVPLTVDTAGGTTFGGAVGGAVPLLNLTVASGPATFQLANGGAVTTRGFQSYQGAVTLAADTALVSQNAVGDGGGISFAQTVDGAFALNVNTSGRTVFGGAVGGAVPLASVTTGDNTPGTSVFQGGGVFTTGAQTYGDAVTLPASKIIFQSGGAEKITFGQTVDGSADLTLDTTGASTFAGDVGGNTALASLTVQQGPASVTGNRVVTNGNQDYAGMLTLGPSDSGRSTLQSTAGTLFFRQDVRASGSLLALGRYVAALGNIATNGNLDLESSGNGQDNAPVLLLGGTSYVSGGSVTLNTTETNRPMGLAATKATIILSNPGRTVIRGTSFDMGGDGNYQKLYSAGAVNIDVGGGVAALGDVAARDSIRVAASTIDLRSRPAVDDSGGRPNSGLNYVAENGIDFGSARIVFVGNENPTANFITNNGNVVIQRVTGISLFRDPQVSSQFTSVRFDADNIASDTFAATQPLGGGSQALDTAAALSGALPDQKPVDVSSEITITASQMEELKKLGIHPRLAQKSERRGNGSKRALFAQLVDGQDPENYGRLQPIKGGISRLEPSDYVVVVDRMGEREVGSILQSFEVLYGKNKEKAPEIGASFQTAFNDYTVEKQTADPAGFEPFLEKAHGKYPAVDKATRDFDDLFGRIEHLGLTDKEVFKSEEHIVSDLGVAGASPADMVKVINGLRKKLPPGQKAPSTKVPASPPASNPAPGATSPAPPAQQPVKGGAPLKTVDRAKKNPPQKSARRAPAARPDPRHEMAGL